MGRIEELFKRKSERVLNVYCTAGFPQRDDTLEILTALEQNGADLAELGMPYSDPLADGPVIQDSSLQALQNGMTMQLLFEQLRNLRKAKADAGAGLTIPVILMGYMNPVLQYGFENFCRDAAAVGVDGLILPDLPEYEFETEYGAIIRKYNLDFIFLVTPETSEERVRRIDALTSGFLYAVSSSSTTGKDQSMNEVGLYLDRLKSMKLKNPVLVGFGIKDKESFDSAASHANGAIIGTAFIRAIKDSAKPAESAKEFLSAILG